MKNQAIMSRPKFLSRKRRVRAKISGTDRRPRLSVHRSLHHITAQLIDDVHGRTLCSASDRQVNGSGNKTAKAQAVGSALATVATKQGISQVVFDRSGYKYHGRVKALADAARSGGLKF